MIPKNYKKLIDARVEEINREKIEQAEKKEREYAEAITACENLYERISALIDTANYIEYAGIKLPLSNILGKYGYKYSAFAEGYYHGVGFLKGDSDDIAYIGVLAGGACGDWNLIFSKNGYYSIHQRTHERRAPKLHHLKRFLEDFPKFEKAFYLWIEDGMKQTEADYVHT